MLALLEWLARSLGTSMIANSLELPYWIASPIWPVEYTSLQSCPHQSCKTSSFTGLDWQSLKDGLGPFPNNPAGEALVANQSAFDTVQGH